MCAYSFSGCIDLQSAYNLYDDLKMAQNHLVLINDLHILYLVTPYDLTNQFKPIGSVYYDVVSFSHLIGFATFMRYEIYLKK